jgi:hypothetical protein
MHSNRNKIMMTEKILLLTSIFLCHQYMYLVLPCINLQVTCRSRLELFCVFKYLAAWRTLIYLSMALQPFVGPWSLFQFFNLYIAGRTPWTGDQPVARPLPTQNKRTETSMTQVGFELTIPVFEGAKTVYALDSAVTVIGWRTLIPHPARPVNSMQ